MLNKKLLCLLLLSVLNFISAQQNEEFFSVKKYFDQQRSLLNIELRKRFNDEENLAEKLNIKNDFVQYMTKMDSIENTAFINALIKVKNREDIDRLDFGNFPSSDLNNPAKSELSSEAEYPGGINNLRSQLRNLFYPEAVYPNEKHLKTNVVFVVEQDGYVSTVRAEGDNSTFNRQAEIAMYQLPEKFNPAVLHAKTVRYRFCLPLAMDFE